MALFLPHQHLSLVLPFVSIKLKNIETLLITLLKRKAWSPEVNATLPSF